MIVIILLLMLIIALLDCLIRKDLRHSMIFAFPIIILIGIYVWLFTLLPVQWGLKKMPFIELVQIKEVPENDCQDSTIYSGIIEFISDKTLNGYNLIVMKGSSIKNLSWKVLSKRLYSRSTRSIVRSPSKWMNGNYSK